RKHRRRRGGPHLRTGATQEAGERQEGRGSEAMEAAVRLPRGRSDTPPGGSATHTGGSCRDHRWSVTHEHPTQVGARGCEDLHRRRGVEVGTHVAGAVRLAHGGYPRVPATSEGKQDTEARAVAR